jgi:hypothetical protein
MKAKAIISFYFGLAFLSILALLHFIEPEFNPSWRMISEYELGKYGFLMTVDFFCWGGGFIFLLLSIWNLLNTISGRIGKWWLLIISIALFGAGLFRPQPITDTTRGTIDAIHSICGVLMIFTFPMVSILISKSLSKSCLFQSSKPKLFWLTTLVWIGFLVFLISSIIFQPKNREYNSDYLIGWPNRFMVVCYTLWLLGLSRHIINFKHAQK